jgi:hypothetical protein
MPMRLLLALTAVMTAANSPTLLAQDRPSGGPSKIYTVCEALKERRALQGQTVAGGHGSFLTGTCQPRLVARGFTWPDAIWLSPQPSPDAYDYQADRRVRKEISRLHPRKTDQIILTLRGHLRGKGSRQERRRKK